jgi:hypothetical protein
MKALKRFLENFLPHSLLMLFGFIYGIFYKKISYSQYGEDLIVINYFKKIGVKKGVYVDIGCFHPSWISNTHLLHRMGWVGYAFDIDKIKLLFFRLIRQKKCKTVWGAICQENNIDNEPVVVYKFKQAYSAIDTLDLEHAKKISKASGIPFYAEYVPKVSLNKALKEVGKVNLLNIDIEGLDEVVLLSIDINAISPDLIIFEDNLNWGGSKKLRDLMDANGYERLFISQGSIGYAKPVCIL